MESLSARPPGATPCQRAIRISEGRLNGPRSRAACTKYAPVIAELERIGVGSLLLKEPTPKAAIRREFNKAAMLHVLATMPRQGEEFDMDSFLRYVQRRRTWVADQLRGAL